MPDNQNLNDAKKKKKDIEILFLHSSFSDNIYF